MGWAIGGVLFSVMSFFLALVRIAITDGTSAGMEWPAIIFAIIAFVMFKKAHKGRQMKIQRRKDEYNKQNRTFLTEDELNSIASGILPKIQKAPIIPAEGEVVHFYAPAGRYITKKKAVGRTGSGGGISVRVAKGVSLRSGGGASTTIYGNVTDGFIGQVVLTNQRIIFIAKQNGFECKLKTISSITKEDDGTMIQSGAKTYRLVVEKQGYFDKALSMVVNE